MKAWIYYGIEDIRLEERILSPCGDDDAIIKNRYATICGTDIHAYRLGGEDVRIPSGSEFGHEVCSEIVCVGKNVRDLFPGQRVFPLGMFCAPNSRKACATGGFSEYIYVNNAKANYNLFPISDADISDETIALIEPLSVGWRAASETKPVAGQNAIVFGAGGIGVGAAMALRMLGCNEIFVVDRLSERLGITEDFGFGCVNTTDPEWRQFLINQLGTARGPQGVTVNAPIMIESTGSEEILSTALQMLPLFGTLQIVGLYEKPQTINLSRVTFGAQKIVGGGGGRIQEVESVINMLRSHRFDVNKLITKSYPHEELEAAICDAMHQHNLKIGIDYRATKESS